MAYREVTMIEITEVLRQWLAGAGRKRMARMLGVDPKTVRHYVHAARQCGLTPRMPATALTEERLVSILTALRSNPGRPRGESWARCAEHRAFIDEHLQGGVRLSKIRRLLARRGVEVARRRSTASPPPSSATARPRRRSRSRTGIRARSSTSTRAG